MDGDARPDLLYQLLAETFTGLGAAGPMVRAFLLRDRYFAGQEFRCGGFQAIFLAGQDEIEFYDNSGARLKKVRVQPTEEQKAG